MNPSVSHVRAPGENAGLIWIASAIVLVGILVDTSGWIQSSAQCCAQSGSDATARNFAHSVQLSRYKTDRDYAKRAKPTAKSPSASSPKWYRYALPISMTAFLVSFSLWALHAHPNHACRSIKARIPGPAVGTEAIPVPKALYHGTPPTSACPHEVGELRPLPVEPAWDPGL